MNIKISKCVKIAALIGAIISSILFRTLVMGDDSNLLVFVVFGIIPGGVVGIIVGYIIHHIQKRNIHPKADHPLPPLS
jgi:ABC-type xylose transport system permease subunit